MISSRRMENQMGALTMKELDTNNDDWISAEEAFPYAAEKTDEYLKVIEHGPAQNPLIYDGYEGELKISYVG